MARPEVSVDYTGQQGGMMALAFAAGWAVATTLWLAVAGTIWKLFLEPRIKGLEKTIDGYEDRIKQLETILLWHPPGPTAQRTQAAFSELNVGMDDLKKKGS